jgi:outer membrane protein assembly factor BamB
VRWMPFRVRYVALIGVLLVAAILAMWWMLPSAVHRASADEFPLLWKRATEWKHLRSPVVADGTIYIMAEHGVLSALDIEDGSVVRRFRPQEPGTYEPCVIDGDVLYLPCGNSNMTAIDLRMKRTLWSTYVVPPDFIEDECPIHGGGHPEYGVSSPAVGSKHLYFVSDNLYALEKNSGRQAWEFPAGGDIFAPPTLVDDVLYVTASTDSDPVSCALVAVDAETGNELWRMPIEEGVWWGQVSFFRGTLFLIGGQKSVVAIDPATRTIKWKQAVGEKLRTRAFATEELLCVAEERAVYGLDPESGRILWSNTVGGHNPMVHRGRAYILSHGSGLCVLDARTGDLIEKHAVDGTGFFCRPVIADDRLLVATEAMIYCFSLAQR